MKLIKKDKPICKRCNNETFNVKRKKRCLDGYMCFIYKHIGMRNYMYEHINLCCRLCDKHLFYTYIYELCSYGCYGEECIGM